MASSKKLMVIAARARGCPRTARRRPRREAAGHADQGDGVIDAAPGRCRKGGRCGRSIRNCRQRHGGLIARLHPPALLAWAGGRRGWSIAALPVLRCRSASTRSTSSESPPRSKKLSSRPTFSMPSARRRRRRPAARSPLRASHRAARVRGAAVPARAARCGRACRWW